MMKTYILFFSLLAVPVVAQTSAGGMQVIGGPTTIGSATTLPYAPTLATNAVLGNYFRVTLTGNATLAAPTGMVDGQKVLWEFVQDATGSRTLSLPANFHFGTDVTGAALSTTANAHDFLGAIYNATTNVWYVTTVIKGYN